MQMARQSYIESADMDIGDGRVMFVTRALPDIETSGTVDVTFKTRKTLCPVLQLKDHFSHHIYGKN